MGRGKLCDAFTTHIWTHRAMGRMNSAGRNEGMVSMKDSNLQHKQGHQASSWPSSGGITSPHVCLEQSTASVP